MMLTLAGGPKRACAVVPRELEEQPDAMLDGGDVTEAVIELGAFLRHAGLGQESA